MGTASIHKEFKQKRYRVDANDHIQPYSAAEMDNVFKKEGNTVWFCQTEKGDNSPEYYWSIDEDRVDVYWPEIA